MQGEVSDPAQSADLADVRVLTKTKSRRRSELQQDVESIRKVGGRRATGERYSRREKLHMLISGIPWLSVQLIAALVDIVILLIKGDLEWPRTILVSSGLVTIIFCIDLVLRIFTYRRVLLATWFSIVGCLTDALIVLLSLLFWCFDAAAVLGLSSSPIVGFFRSLVVCRLGIPTRGLT